MLIITNDTDVVNAANAGLPNAILKRIYHHWRLATERSLIGLTCILVAEEGDPTVVDLIEREGDWLEVITYFTERIYTVGNQGFAYIVITYPKASAADESAEGWVL